MKLPTFNLAAASWDAYKAFHIDHGPFVQFDTGEVILAHCGPRNRRKYGTLEVRISGSGDADFPNTLRAPDGTKVPKAWLNDQGQITLLFDDATRIAVNIKDRSYRRSGQDAWSRDCNVPSRFLQYAMVYFPGEGRKPIGSLIPLRHPCKDKHAHELVMAARAWMGLSDAEKPAGAACRRHAARRAGGVSPETLAGVKFADLDNDVRRRLALAGVGLATTWVPYLTWG